MNKQGIFHIHTRKFEGGMEGKVVRGRGREREKR